MAEDEPWGDLVPDSPSDGAGGGMRWADHTEEHSPTLNALTEEAARMRAAMAKKKPGGRLEDFALDAPTAPYFLDLSGLTNTVTEDQLGWWFSDKKVDVTRIEILRTKGGQSTGMACMEVGDEWSYKTALGLSNSKFKDRTLKVTASSKGKAQFTSRGGGRGGSSSAKYEDGKYGNGSWESGGSKGKGRAGRFGVPAWDGGGKGGKGSSYEPAAGSKKGKDAKGKGAKEEPPAKGKGGKKEEPKKKKEEPKPVKKEEPKPVKKEEPKVEEKDSRALPTANGPIPKERPKLNLLPRTRPMDAPPPESMKPKFDPFGGAKPRDETAAQQGAFKETGEKRVADSPAPAPLSSPAPEEKPEGPGKGPDSSPKSTPPMGSPSSTASWRGGGGKRGGKGKSPKSGGGEYVWRVAGADSSADAKEEDTPGTRGRGRGGKKRR